MVVGGTFTQVQHQGSPVQTRRYIAAFDAQTGAIRGSFTPALDNSVEVIIPAADGQSVYVGGRFSSVNGANERRLTRLNLSNGQRVSGFDAPAFDGIVKDLRLHPNGNLIIARDIWLRGGTDPTSTGFGRCADG